MQLRLKKVRRLTSQPAKGKEFWYHRAVFPISDRVCHQLRYSSSHHIHLWLVANPNIVHNLGHCLSVCAAAKLRELDVTMCVSLHSILEGGPQQTEKLMEREKHCLRSSLVRKALTGHWIVPAPDSVHCCFPFRFGNGERRGPREARVSVGLGGAPAR